MSFIFGLLAAVIALTLQLIIWLFYPALFDATLPLNIATIFSLLILAFTEELVRFSFIRQYLHQFSPSTFGKVFFFTLGFILIENSLSLWGGSFSLKLLLPSFLHFFLTLLAFFFLPKTPRFSSFLAVVGLSTGIHLLFNAVSLYW